MSRGINPAVTACVTDMARVPLSWFWIGEEKPTERFRKAGLLGLTSQAERQRVLCVHPIFLMYGVSPN